MSFAVSHVIKDNAVDADVSISASDITAMATTFYLEAASRSASTMLPIDESVEDFVARFFSVMRRCASARARYVLPFA